MHTYKDKDGQGPGGVARTASAAVYPQVDVSADETGHNQLPIWTEADECEEVANGHDLPHRGSLLRLHQVPVGTVLSQRHSTHSCATRMSTWTMGSRNRSES